MEKIWLKRVFVPLWVIQIIILIIYIIAGALAFAIADNARNAVADNENTTTYSDSDVEVAAEAVDLAAIIDVAFSAFTLILIITEIILFGMHKLRPVGNVVIQSLKTTVWTVWTILTLIAIGNGGTSGLSIFLVLVMFLTCLALLIYGGVILSRHRKGTLYRGTYARAETGQNVPSAYEPQLQSYAPYNPANAPPSHSFRDSSPAPSSQKPGGEAASYYGGNAASNSYEMQGTGQRYG